MEFTDGAAWAVVGCSTVAGSYGTRPPIRHREPSSQLLRLLPETCSGLSFKCLGKDAVMMALGKADPF